MSLSTSSSLVVRSPTTQERLDAFYNVSDSPEVLANTILDDDKSAKKKRKLGWPSISSLGLPPTTLNLNIASSPHLETISNNTAVVQSASSTSVVEESAIPSAAPLTNQATAATTTTSVNSPTNVPSNTPLVGTPTVTLQMFPQYLAKFEPLLKNYPIAYKNALIILRRKKVSVIIFTRHRNNGTFPKDIDYTKKDSNPYPKDCRNRVQHLEHEQQSLQEFKLAVLNYRLSIYMQELTTFEQTVDTITHVDKIFPELEQYFAGHTPENATQQFTEYQNEYVNFKTQLRLKLADQFEQFKQWEHNCDLKHRRENPDLYAHERSTATAADEGTDYHPMEDDDNVEVGAQPVTALSRNELCDLIKEVLTSTLNDLSSTKSLHNITSSPSNTGHTKKQQKTAKKPSTSHQPKQNKKQSNNESTKPQNTNNKKRNYYSHNNKKTNASGSSQSNARNKQSSSFQSTNKNKPSSYLEALKSNLQKVNADLSSLQTKLSSYDPNFNRKKTNNHQNSQISSSRSKPKNHFRFESELRGNDRKTSRR